MSKTITMTREAGSQAIKKKCVEANFTLWKKLISSYKGIMGRSLSKQDLISGFFLAPTPT